MKIYKVYDGKLASIEVEKETAMFYFVDSPRCFGYGSRVRKEWACLTPKEAIQEHINRLKERIGMHTDRLEDANNDMVVALKLESELG